MAAAPAPATAAARRRDAPAPRAGRPGRPRRARHTDGTAGWWFIAPNLVGMLLFTLIPVVAAVLIAFTDWDVVSGLGGVRFTGLANFTELLSDDRFWHSFKLTGIYTGVSVPLSVLFGLGLAIALNRPVPGRAALRTIFFLPYIVNQVAIGMTWLLLLNPSSGMVNEVLRSVGIDDPPAWFASSDWALPAFMIMAVWGGVGYAAVIYLAALQDLPTDLYEAAAIDGAGPWRRFTTITWPALVPTTTFVFVTLVISVSQSFGLVVLITQGGPGDSTRVLPAFIYQSGFEYYRFGYASAAGLLTFVCVLVLTLSFWRFQKGRALYDD
ncbi:sugar ABC transporter permease [Streptomyces sp. A7024]|uniref:Sugar ABC transporter permease n=1 Tax=Streptomyces coryli TaxID=1128680 RepID=A0A6G4TU33_9ACTN|nr:sugar ABC transporter permease [Streptomyces coryli]NGN62537.1 sugar ABC transporter permease [Streptomyces coryli]